MIQQQPYTQEKLTLASLGESNNLIIITGFTPFGDDTVNASWEAVRLLPDKFNFKNDVYRLEKRLVAVEYEAVDKAISEIWSLKPELVIHVGLHRKIDRINVEKLAYNYKFKRLDSAGKCLRCQTACLNGPSKDLIRTRLNVDLIVETVNKHFISLQELTNVPASAGNTVNFITRVSEDVGEYLCCYIFLKSLDISNSRSLFVHVPPIDQPFSCERMAEVLYQIIKECIRQILEVKTNNC